jgi:hypothetical protein
VLCDLVGDIACATGQPAFVCRTAADTRRAVGFDVRADDLLLPLRVLAQFIDIREDLFRPAVDLDALNDRRHMGLSSQVIGGHTW